MTIEELFKTLTEYAYGNAQEAGRLFERFVRKVLKIHNYYGNKFKEIWLWNDYPERGKRHDTGIDLVALDDEGKKWAIQAKLYQSRKINLDDVSTFIATANPDEFQYRLLVYTGEFTTHAEEIIYSNKVYLFNLEAELENIDFSEFSWDNPENLTYKKKVLKDYQKVAVDRVIKGFKTEDRGKLIMPPGAGKTFTSLKIAEEMVGKGGYVLFMVPSIALAEQTIQAWIDDSELPLRVFAVASDDTLGRIEEDTIKRTLLSIPPTTDPQRLFNEASKKIPDKMTVIISTYQSIDVISQAQQLGLPEFDLIICDEAHKTAGVENTNNQEASVFKKIHSNSYVKGKKSFT